MRAVGGHLNPILIHHVFMLQNVQSGGTNEMHEQEFGIDTHNTHINIGLFDLVPTYKLCLIFLTQGLSH